MTEAPRCVVQLPDTAAGPSMWMLQAVGVKGGRSFQGAKPGSHLEA